MADTDHKKHCNLYYIFEADKKQHPMPPGKLAAVKAALFAHPPPKAPP